MCQSCKSDSQPVSLTPFGNPAKVTVTSFLLLFGYSGTAQSSSNGKEKPG
jgi:hypothetical protein